MIRITDRKTKAAALSVVSNSSLIIMKIIVGIISGSISIISEALHSSVDLVTAVMTLISVRFSAKPPDKSHPYGHGKIENVSGFIEGILIFAVAAVIVFESGKRIISEQPQVLHAATLAIIVMLVSAVVNTLVSARLYKAAKREDSIALEADALHLKTDVYTSAGVGLGLIVIEITDLYFLDPVIAIAVSLLIFKEAWNLSRRAFSPLLDSSLPENEEEIIGNVLNRYSNQDFKFTHLKTRKSGSQKFVDFHAEVNPQISVQEANRVNNLVKKEIRKQLSNVHIHIDIRSRE